ncbi:MAG: 7-cyano-7-deazaguanine synthase QueC [Candidatus Cloacimonetes bacterium]|nr:7-cyano-7-deazaguanine synthase QueC [Candidatus Cloacimonadota bacterium]MCF7813488.1 7-cyano-7-deazaguanine synthase QueC [Candidatus Cloacimonadota bacterium]MCF7868589.1 7-cyano-7-deazaguanine synthase QueC [Candidatus Cloacimonadota bacterium]MCF7883376.1 7-cyano-7-deazaguanine synthase QueC [Candidatus Cloacimonadota bacterium]
MSKAVVLVSGGMDSLVTAAIAKKECDELYFLHVNYGQRTEVRELRSFRKMKDYFKPKDVLIADIAYLTQIGGSSLTDENIEVKDHQENGNIPNTYVPFRNSHIIAIGVSWAEVIGADKIYIGAMEEDSSGYPDCREKYFEAMQKAVNEGTKDGTEIQLITPIIHKRKSEIIKLGAKLEVPFDLSWSCYRNNDIACGKCDSCVLRVNAFKAAGLKDPIPYEVEQNW